MTYSIPPHGKLNWDTDNNANLQYVKDTAEAAETPAGAQAKATAAHDSAVATAATDASNKANAVQANLDTTNSTLNTHTANTSNPHSVTKAQVGLGSADNTSDVDKPVSTAQRAALDLKQNHADMDTDVAAQVSGGSQTQAALWRQTGPHPLTGMFHVEGYGADGTGATNSDAAWAACMADANASGGGVWAPGVYATTAPIVIAHDGVTINGRNLNESIIRYTGTDAAIKYDSAAVRRNCGVNRMMIQCMTAGGTAYRLTNSYRGENTYSRFESQNGTTGIGVDLAGSASTSTFHNKFIGCDAHGSLYSVKLDNNVNGTEWVGGVLEGSGASIYAPGTTSTSGTNMFFGAGIQSDGTNTGGKIVVFGTSGASTAIQSSYNSLIGCRIETSGATTIHFYENALYNSIIGGSCAGTTTITDHSASKQNTWFIAGGPTNNYWTGDQRANQWISSPASTAETIYGGSRIRANGTGADQTLYLSPKGTGSVQVGAFANDGTGGFQAWSGGATPALRAALGPNRGIDLSPAVGNDALRVNKAGESWRRLSIDELGQLNWGDGTTSPDTQLMRLSAKSVGVPADHTIRTGRAATASRPSAATAGVGAMFFDTTLNKPIWSNGTAWVDATGATV